MPGILYMTDGTVRKYSDIGCYPIFYIASDGGCLCADCVQEDIEMCCDKDESQWFIIAHEANWEDPNLYCEHCSQRIESAYAEEEASWAK